MTFARRTPRALFAAALLLFALAVSTLPRAADDGESPRLSDLYETTTSSLVLVEFWARDPDGKAVTGLRPDEVQLFVDGGHRPFVAMEPALQAGGTPLPAAPFGGAGPAAERARRFVLFFNDGLSSPDRMSRARRAALDFLSQGGAPDDLLAIVNSEEGRYLRLIQGFSADRKEVAEALRRDLDDGTRASSLALETARPRPDGDDGKIGRAVVDPARARQFEVSRRFLGRQIRATGRGTADALEAVIGWLSPFRGPKAILLFGDNFAGATREELDEVSRAASAASVTIHTANTRGLTMSSSHDSLAVLSLASGGLRAISNDPAEIFRRLDAEAAGEYVLSFAPRGPADGRPHSLRVASTRPGVRVRCRKIFIRETPEQTRKREIEAAFLAPELHSGFALDAMLPLRGGEARDLLLYVPAGRLLFVPAGPIAVAQVEVGAVARDERGKVVANVSRRLEVHLGQETAAKRPAVNLRLRDVIPVGARSVTTVLMDVRSGTIGASLTETALESHAAGLTGFAVGLPGERSLWISAGTAGRSGTVQEPEASAFAASRRMRFRTTENPLCEVRFEGAWADRHGLRILLMEGDSPSLLLPLDGADIVGTAGAGTVLRIRLPLVDIPAGDFILKVEQARDTGCVELGRLPLRVVSSDPV